MIIRDEEKIKVAKRWLNKLEPKNTKTLKRELRGEELPEDLVYGQGIEARVAGFVAGLYSSEIAYNEADYIEDLAKWDFKTTLPYNEFRFEVKNDSYAGKTGSLYVEFCEINKKDKGTPEHLTGIFNSSAHYVVFTWENEERELELVIADRQAVIKLIKDSTYPYAKTNVSNNPTAGFLVPIEHVIKLKGSLYHVINEEINH